jgi:hypothetical protein
MRHEIDAYIRTRAHYSSNNEIDRVDVTWEGGTIAGISKALLDDVDPRYVQRNGNLITFGSLQVRIVDFDVLTECYFVERVTGEGHGG